jgi:hypothetical protein
MMDKTKAKIQSIDTAAWTEEDKISYQTILTSLKTAIDACLTQLQGLG